MQQQIDTIKSIGKIKISSHSKGYKATVTGRTVIFSYISYNIEKSVEGLHKQIVQELERVLTDNMDMLNHMGCEAYILESNIELIESPKLIPPGDE